MAPLQSWAGEDSDGAVTPRSPGLFSGEKAQNVSPASRLGSPRAAIFLLLCLSG